MLHLFVVKAMWWYDAFYILLTYFYILIDRCFYLSFNLYPTPQGLLQKVLTNVGLLYTSEYVMLEYIHCMRKYVCCVNVRMCVCGHVCVYVHMCECVPEGNATH